MPSKIRVLIVDDSTVARRFLTQTLQRDEEIEVVATAANGKIALAKIPQVSPDAITLDIEMPEMDGIETLNAIRQKYPDLPVIMFSSVTTRGAEATLDALSKGANDYSAKPDQSSGIAEAMNIVQADLVPKIKCHCGRPPRSVAPASGPSATATDLCRTKQTANARRIDIVAIGVSTGGPSALQEILPKLPSSFPVPIVVVQHMPKVFTSHLAERLNNLSRLDIKEARENDCLEAGGVWIAPGDFHMTLHRAGTDMVVGLDKSIPQNSCRPSVDVLFRSVASTYGKHTYSIILTGMGKDGAEGCAQIREVGGCVHVQDEESSVVWGMPGAVASRNLANKILPLDKIASEMTNQANFGRTAQTQLQGV